jgi:hypothetical protein
MTLERVVIGHGGQLNNPEAILIPANRQEFREVGDVELHRRHLKDNGGVFWDIIPAGDVDVPWKHPEIKSGYFYISGEGIVRYWMNIEYIRRWKDLNLDEVKKYLPSFRKPELPNYYAILIRHLEPLQIERKLEDFTLVSTGQQVKLVRNYAIVKDERYR